MAFQLLMTHTAVRYVNARPTADERSVAKLIAAYFLRNPQAADTLEGIARWRLLDEQIHQSVRTTTEAVQLLVKMGLLVAERSGPAGVLYRLNESRRSHAAQFAAGGAGPPRREPRGGGRGHK
jgi:hypothetical protein